MEKIKEKLSGGFINTTIKYVFDIRLIFEASNTIVIAGNNVSASQLWTEKEEIGIRKLPIPVVQVFDK